MVFSLVMVGLLVVVTGGTGAAAWWATAPQASFTFGPPPAAPVPTGATAPDTSDTATLLWLAGFPGRPGWLPLLQAGAAGLATLVAWVATGNPLAAGIVGVLGWHVPRALIRRRAVARWRAADREAYALTNTLALTLPIQGHPVAALRQLLPDLHEPLRSWLQAALAREAVGEGVEEGLHALAARLGHMELGLLAEILRADRREKPSGDLLHELLDAWTVRIHHDERRLGKLATARTFTTLIIGGPVVGFVLLGGLDPTALAPLRATIVGQAVGGLGMALLGFAAQIAHRTVREAEGVIG